MSCGDGCTVFIRAVAAQWPLGPAAIGISPILRYCEGV